MKASAYIVSIYLGLSIVILALFDGTGGEADSINHYLHAKYAFKHPSLFFNHWAKPLFTLLAAPFAQFGFIGVKLFNVLCSLCSVYYTYQIARKLNLKAAYLAPLFLFLFPLSFLTTFSGLTEPLSAALLTLSIYLSLNNKNWQAALLISFLPFVRSEGLLFMLVFAAFMAFKKEWRVIPYLLVGHLVYSLVGFPHYGDFLWVFNKIPYAHLNSHYGDGRLLHFADQFIYITGVPLLIFFLLGVFRLLFKGRKKNSLHFSFLILLNLLVFYVAHSLFWHLGIFNSMGLKRVFATVTPLIAILALYGFNLILQLKHLRLKQVLHVLSLTYILVFPFTSNPASIAWKEEMNLSTAQSITHEIASYINSSQFEVNRMIYTDPYLGEALRLDPFDHSNRLILSKEILTDLEPGDLIIWDNWHSVVDYHVELDELKNYKRIKAFKHEESNYVLFQVE